jgi:hypothetical protein
MWKVLSGNGSAFVDGKAKVEYQKNKWVNAPEWLAKEGYHLCVFSIKKDADLFKEGFGDKVVKCHVRRIHKKLPPFLSKTQLYNGLMRRVPPATWPPSTIMVEQVKILDG